MRSVEVRMSHSDAADIAVASLVLCGGLGLATALTQCAGAAPGVPTKDELAGYAAEQGWCVTYPTLETARTCVQAVRSEFCQRYPDLASCKRDGGADHDAR